MTDTFFQAGRTYTDGDGYTAPEITVFFHVEHVTRHPERGRLRAIGWVKSGAIGAKWRGTFLDEDEFAGWNELDKPLLAAADVQPARRTEAQRLWWLLSVISSERGQWTVGRVKRLYGRHAEGHVLRSTIRRELAALAAAGELVVHDGSDRRYYTVAPGRPR